MGVIESVRDGNDNRGGGGLNCCLNKFKYFSPVFAESDLKFKTLNLKRKIKRENTILRGNLLSLNRRKNQDPSGFKNSPICFRQFVTIT